MANSKPFSQGKFLSIASFVIVIGWFLWVSLTLIFVLGGIFPKYFNPFANYIVLIIYSVGAYTLLCIILMFAFKCDVCKKKLLIEKKEVNRKFKKLRYLGGYGTIVTNVLTTRCFVCMHCGTRFRIKSRKNNDLKPQL